MTRRDECSLLWDVVVHGRLALEFFNGMSLERYIGDVQCQSAVERQLIIVGEAAGHLARLDASISRRLSEPVHQVVGLRNVLVHGYDTVVPEKVYGVLCGELTELVSSAEEILLELGGEPLPAD